MSKREELVEEADKKMVTITYKGRSIKTSYFAEHLSDEDCEVIRQNLRKKPSIKDVEHNIVNIDKGMRRTTAITDYYFLDIMRDVRLHHSVWTLNEVIECNDLIRRFYGLCESSDYWYPKDWPKHKQVKKAMMSGGMGIAQKPSNFPLSAVDKILDKYNINGNYCDPSCGWGNRMMGAMRRDINYYGTDPNNKLYERLLKLEEKYKDITGRQSKVDIRCQGSEEFVPEWEGKMGLVFTSPPYFNLEDYSHGDQSYKEGVSYEQWIDDYLKPTIDNSYRYLVDEGYLAINIKNFKSKVSVNGKKKFVEHDLVGDIKKFIEDKEMKYVATETVRNHTRSFVNGDKANTNEGIFIYKKLKENVNNE